MKKATKKLAYHADHLLQPAGSSAVGAERRRGSRLKIQTQHNLAQNQVTNRNSSYNCAKKLAPREFTESKATTAISLHIAWN